ncbi:MAG: hypothetical protein M1839_001605 [Geoglossum umbratile]|nr:MAG: hypothetical protein M1839_001605 [Geoglossum umbratile]
MDVVTTGSSPEDLLALLPTLPSKAQLERILGLLAAADDCEDRRERLTSKAWTYLVDNQLWRAASLTENQSKELGLAGYQLKDRELPEIPGPQRTRASRDSESLGTPTQGGSRSGFACASPAQARVLLSEAVRRRVSTGGLGRWAASPHASVVDVLGCLERLRSCLEQLRSRPKDANVGVVQAGRGPTVAVTGPMVGPEVKPTEAKWQDELDKPDKPDKPKEQTKQPKLTTGASWKDGTNLGDERGLTLLGQARKAGLGAMCQPRLRLLAADLTYRDLRSGSPGGSDATDDLLWPKICWVFLDTHRHGRETELLMLKGYSHTLDLPDLREMIDTEFAIYRHHHRTLPETPRLGKPRNMYYSSIQQLARQDPVWYALTVAARPDKLWRLISYPYITKDTDAGGEATGFLHMDLDLEAFLEDGRGGSRLTGSLSLDDEDREGCTVVVKGFHHYLTRWAQVPQQRGWKGSGPTANCSSIYTAQDRAQWGEVKGVPCPAWGISITLPQLIHGSTPKSIRRRRTILPWFMGIGEDHEQLEISGCASWSEVRDCHLDLLPAERDPSGYRHRLGAPKGRFRGSVVLGSSSALGDALLGRRKWTDVEVLWERDLLLGSDCQAARSYVQRARASLVEQYRKAFLTMAQAEREEFGDASYFVAEPLGIESGSRWRCPYKMSGNPRRPSELSSYSWP